MAGDSDIDALLAGVAAYGVSGADDLPCDDAEQALGRVLDAVQSTVLPRLLTVHINDAPGPALHVAGGRVARVTGMAPPGFDDLTGRGLAPGDAGRLAEMLSAALAGAARLAIRTTRLEDRSDAPSGVHAAQIGAALGLAPFGTAPGDRAADLLTAAEDVLIAATDTDGNPYKGDIPEAVAPFIAGQLRDPDGLAQACNAGEALFLELDAPAVSIGFIPTGDGTMAIVFQPGALPDLAACWTETGGWGPVG